MDWMAVLKYKQPVGTTTSGKINQDYSRRPGLLLNPNNFRDVFLSMSGNRHKVIQHYKTEYNQKYNYKSFHI